MAEEPKDKIYLQLHEQYAINNNANLSTIMTLVVALIVVIGYFGYVFISTSAEFYVDKRYVLYDPYKCQYSLLALMLVYLASLFILAILSCLCTYQGVAQRKEQFIIHAIRNREEYNMTRDTILPESYHPYLKKGIEIVQGLYGELLRFFCLVSLTLTLAMIVKTLLSIIYEIQNSNFNDKASCIIISLFSCVVIVFLIWVKCRRYYHKQYNSYISRQMEYIQEYLIKKLDDGGQDDAEIKNKLKNAIEEIKKHLSSYDLYKEYQSTVDDMKKNIKNLKEPPKT